MSASQVYSNSALAGGQAANCTCMKGAYDSLFLYSADNVPLLATGASNAILVPGAVATDVVVCTRTFGATLTTGIGAVILAAAGTAGANYVVNSTTAEAGTCSLVTYRFA